MVTSLTNNLKITGIFVFLIMEKDFSFLLFYNIKPYVIISFLHFNFNIVI